MKMTTATEEEVGGVVVGPYLRCGQLTYDGRPQGQQLWAEDEAGLVAKAEAWIAKRRAEIGRAWLDIYPATGRWAVRIYS